MESNWMFFNNNCNIGNIARVAQVSVLFLIFLPDNLAG